MRYLISRTASSGLPLPSLSSMRWSPLTATSSAPDAPATLALTAAEIGVLDRLVDDKPTARQKTLSYYLVKIARLGGYLARASDPPPGNTVIWRGLSRLTDIALGAMVGAEFVGN